MDVSLERLFELDRSIQAPAFLPQLGGGLRTIGLILIHDAEDTHFEKTPLLARPFAHFGWEGVHLSTISLDLAQCSSSLIVLTIPNGVLIDRPTNYVLAEGLRDFLELGYYAGFGPLCGYHVNPIQTVHILSNENVELNSDWPELAKHNKDVLLLLRETFALKAPRDLERKLDHLQLKYQSYLIA